MAVDDDQSILEMLRFILQKQAATVLMVDSVAKAVENLEAFAPDVILSDIGMPDYNGYGLVALVRDSDQKGQRNTPIIALTGYTSPSDMESAFAAGFQKYMGKPFDPAELIEVIRSVVTREAARN